VEHECGTPEARPDSRAELSLEISRVVSRVLRGEAIDCAEAGEALAARFGELGVSGEMIGEAISRATGMMGMIRENAAQPPPGLRASAGGTIVDTSPAAEERVSGGNGGAGPAPATAAVNGSTGGMAGATFRRA
jgi:hypothetical protein